LIKRAALDLELQDGIAQFARKFWYDRCTGRPYYKVWFVGNCFLGRWLTFYMTILKAVVILMLFAIDMVSADSISTTLSVRIMPQVVLSMQGEVVAVRIRLSDMGKAEVWMADSCAIPLADSKIIARSGTYEIALSTLSGTGRLLCLHSAIDGLSESAPLPQSFRCPDATCSSI
jgi:hypothetical protein